VITFVGVNRLVKAVVSSKSGHHGQQRQIEFCIELAKAGVTSSEAEVRLSDWQLGE
jgi:hypothetical protein